MGNAKIKNDLKGTKNVVQLKDTLAILFSYVFLVLTMKIQQKNDRLSQKIDACHKRVELVRRVG